MKINQSPLDSSAVSQLNKTPATGAGSTSRSGAAASDRDNVQLSGLSARLLDSGGADSPERAARIQQIASDVRSGQYQVDAKQLSSLMVNEAIRQ